MTIDIAHEKALVIPIRKTMNKNYLSESKHTKYLLYSVGFYK